jgi:sugar O-acyltransferase (sialic acid O-acetyltransferase NeuD family)
MTSSPTPTRTMPPLIIFGGGGHAKVVADIARCAGRTIRAFVDPHAGGAMFEGAPVLRRIEDLPDKDSCEAVIALGDNALRLDIATSLAGAAPGIAFAALVHPSASIAGSVVLGAGTVVMAQAAIAPASTIGRHVIVNTHASIDHDCSIGDFASIAPGAVLGGGVSVGRLAAISIGAVIRHALAIGENTVIGAGAAVLKDMPANVVAYGNPCRIIRPRRLGEPYL